MGRGRARGRLQPGRVAGAGRTAGLPGTLGHSVLDDVGRGSGHPAATRLARRHPAQHTTEPGGARDPVRLRGAGWGRVGNPGARQQVLSALRDHRRSDQPHQLPRQLRHALPGRPGAALPESWGGANRLAGRSQVVLGNGVVHRIHRHSRDPRAGAVRERNGRFHGDRLRPGSGLRAGAGLQGDDPDPRLARSFEAARRWINWFEPSGDVFRLLLRGLYEDSVHPFLLVHTVPEGKRTGLCLSHDVDAREAFRNALTFAQMEAGLGVRSTFFVTTKYFTDSTDIGYYTPDRVQWIRQVKALGSDVGSHSVSHSFAFERFPTGSPAIDSARYDPKRPTVFGEVLVSKQLLDRDLKQQTRGFRAGYLLYPDELLRVLEEAGYFRSE